MNPEIIHAPPRRVVLIQLAAMAVIGASTILLAKFYLFPWMSGYLKSGMSHAVALHRFKIVMFGVGAPLFLFAIYAGHFGFRILRQGRWPLTGALVFRDTPVQRGRAARARGILFVVLAVLLAACGVGLAAIPYFLSS